VFARSAHGELALENPNPSAAEEGGLKLRVGDDDRVLLLELLLPMGEGSEPVDKPGGFDMNC